MVKQESGRQTASIVYQGGPGSSGGNGHSGGRNDFLVRGVDTSGTEHKRPVILQMNDDDFPGRFLQDLASPDQPAISSTTVVNGSKLFQPVQRMLHLAMVKLNCNSLSYPRVDPTRVLSAGLVIRRVFRQPGPNGGPAVDDLNTLSAWMRSAAGQFKWVRLGPHQEDLDPDPLQRPQITSGQAALDLKLTALSLANAWTESTTPAFAAPPATCATLNRTVFYAVIPTASSEVSDTPPKIPPLVDRKALIQSLPPPLRSSSAPAAPASGLTIDYRWMTDDFLNALYPPTAPSASNPAPPKANPAVTDFQNFATGLRMLHSVFGAFDGTTEGNQIFGTLNNHNVTFGQSPNTTTQPMGDFYLKAKEALLDYNAYPNPSPQTATKLTMPTAWDALNDGDQKNLVDALVAALTPRSQKLLAPQARFHDSNPPRRYRLRLFFRIKAETPGCPPELVWSQYSEPFQIAAWYETGQRSHPPVSLPDPTLTYMKDAKPNCTFHVPGNLMGAMQNTSLSGLMKGAGGGGGLNLDWICGFNIPLITICAFFVLNIFLGLLNIIFFWLPFIKICIPFPAPSPSEPDDDSP
jgi:hypothetical protein